MPSRHTEPRLVYCVGTRQRPSRVIASTLNVSCDCETRVGRCIDGRALRLDANKKQLHHTVSTARCVAVPIVGGLAFELTRGLTPKQAWRCCIQAASHVGSSLLLSTDVQHCATTRGVGVMSYRGTRRSSFHAGVHAGVHAGIHARRAVCALCNPPGQGLSGGRAHRCSRG